MSDPISLNIKININDTVPLKLYEKSQFSITTLELQVKSLLETIDEANSVISELQDDLQK